MNKTACLILAALLGSLCGTAAAGAAQAQGVRSVRVCVLDQAAILQQSDVARNMAAQFQQIRQQAQSAYETEKRRLEADQRALDSLAASLPPGVLNSRRAELAQRSSGLVARGEQVNRDLAQLDSELTNNIARLSAPTVRAVEAERGCSMLIARGTLLNLADLSLDITETVVLRMNAAARTPAAGR